jgi:hypothetical protein
LAGDRIHARIPGLTRTDYTVSLWFWSGSSDAAMDGVEWIISRGNAFGLHHEAVGVRKNDSGRRVLQLDCPEGPRDIPAPGKIERWKWNHLVVSRSGGSVRVSLNGAAPSVFDAKPAPFPPSDTFFFGGSCTGEGNFEGRLDEIAFFDRALREEEIIDLHRAGAP